MLLINCEISLQLKWSKNCILVAFTEGNQNPSLKINDIKPLILKQLEYSFKRKINRNKYLAKTTNQAQNRYLD